LLARIKENRNGLNDSNRLDQLVESLQWWNCSQNPEANWWLADHMEYLHIENAENAAALTDIAVDNTRKQPMVEHQSARAAGDAAGGICPASSCTSKVKVRGWCRKHDGAFKTQPALV
jgi:hypothetical protein